MGSSLCLAYFILCKRPQGSSVWLAGIRMSVLFMGAGGAHSAYLLSVMDT